MLKGIRHTGIVVKDLEKMRAFYEKLGFRVVYDEMETNDPAKGWDLELKLKVRNLILRVVKMTAPDGSVLELLQATSHPARKSLIKRRFFDRGLQHIAITVESETEGLLKFIQDPEENFIEIVGVKSELPRQDVQPRKQGRPSNRGE